LHGNVQVQVEGVEREAPAVLPTLEGPRNPKWKLLMASEKDISIGTEGRPLTETSPLIPENQK